MSFNEDFNRIFDDAQEWQHKDETEHQRYRAELVEQGKKLQKELTDYLDRVLDEMRSY